MKTEKDIRFRAVATLSSYDIAHSRYDAKNMIGKKLVEQISYGIIEANIKEHKLVDKIDYSIDLYIASPKTFWEIVRTEAENICRERYRYNIGK